MEQCVIRIWSGPTVDPDDLKILFEWIEWAYYSYKSTI